MMWRRSSGFAAFVVLVAAGAQAAPQDDYMRCVLGANGKPDMLIATCSRVVHAKNIKPEARAAAYLARGNVYRRAQQYQRALADYNESLKLDPDSAPALTSRGNAWRGMDNLDKAIADHTAAVAIDPNYAEAFSNRGNCWADKGEYSRAIADYDRAIDLKPDYAIAYFNRGLSWKAKGDRERAVADYRQALRLQATLAPAADALKTLGEQP